MIENIKKTLKELKKTIKTHNYKIIYTQGKLKYIEDNEILFYNKKDLNIIFLAKRIKNNNTIDIFYYDLNKPNNQQLINFLDKQTYECLICYETNNINNENNNKDLKYKRCPECLIVFCEECFKKLKNCAVCKLCFCCLNKNRCSRDNEQNNNTLFYVIH